MRERADMQKRGKSKGWYDKSTGRWISAKRAHQKVGEVIDGWVKCRNPRTGKFYFMKIDDEYYGEG